MVRVHFKLVAPPCAWAFVFLFLSATSRAQYNHAECELFGPKREQILDGGQEGEKRRLGRLTKLTGNVVSQISKSKPAIRKLSFENPDGLHTIDRHIYEAIQAAGAGAAPKTNSFEFARRVSLDLTGRVPSVARLLAFAANDTPQTRAAFIDELLASPEWVDRWTVFFGDLLKNNAVNNNNFRFPEGRNAYYLWVKDSLSKNKPYNQFVTELLTATGQNSYEDGPLNWLVGGFMGGGPVQDQWDLMGANAAEMFLGLAPMNCILCHDGRKHLDTLNLWGKDAIRLDGYQLAAFFSRVNLGRTPVGANNFPYYWRLQPLGRVTEYQLNTSSGNRPPRTAIGFIRVASPVYPFGGQAPEQGEDYRVALARSLTGDIQFGRAIVNYLWREFFGRGLVEPANQFDPARLDPDNPPPEPWTLQPTHPRMLNEVARAFIDGGYDLKALMRQIVNSETYQLAARFDGEWNPAWEPLFARKFVRRLWGEEIHDAIVQTSGLPVSYPIADTVRGNYTIGWAMQFPEPRMNIRGAGVLQFLDSFYRGNRDDAQRRPDGSATQAMNLMNDTFVMSRVRATGSGDAASLLQKLLSLSDEEMINQMWLTVLSRYPTADEGTKARATLATGARRQQGEDLLWVLYNKTDFFFNY